MDMVWHAADFDGFHFVFTGNAAQIWPKAVTEVGRDERTALFGAEHAMKQGTDIGHARIQPSLRDLGNTELRPPTLKRWVIVG